MFISNNAFLHYENETEFPLLLLTKKLSFMED